MCGRVYLGQAPRTNDLMKEEGGWLEVKCEGGRSGTERTKRAPLGGQCGVGRGSSVST